MRKIIVSLLFIALTSCSKSQDYSQLAINTAFPTVDIPQIAGTQAFTPMTGDAHETVYSPDGKFVAKQYSEINPSGKQAIEIQDKLGNLIWQIPYQANILNETSYSSYIYIYQWAKDSAALYFYYVSHHEVSSGMRWRWHDLRKLNLKTGNIQTVLSGAGFMEFSISPDGTQIAYVRDIDNSSIIFIRNLETGYEKKTNVSFASENHYRVYEISWSPSGSKLAFQSETNDGTVQTIYLNLATTKQKVIKEYKLYAVKFNGWSDDDHLDFANFDTVVHANVNNDEIIVIGTITPVP